MSERWIRIIITVLLVVCFAWFMRIGVKRGDMQETQANASKICLSCMGLS